MALTQNVEDEYLINLPVLNLDGSYFLNCSTGERWHCRPSSEFVKKTRKYLEKERGARVFIEQEQNGIMRKLEVNPTRVLDVAGLEGRRKTRVSVYNWKDEPETKIYLGDICQILINSA